jgi:hypothetical protein
MYADSFYADSVLTAFYFNYRLLSDMNLFGSVHGV